MNKGIPKKIHLIWFGDKTKFKFDLESLKKFAPNYEVKIWGEEDFDWDELFKVPFVEKNYKSQSWAFLTDYLRLKILYEEGGVYLDCDMKPLRYVEDLFIGKELVLAFENNITLSMGLTASTPGNKFFGSLKSIYESTITGKTIMGNMIWDFVAKRDLDMKINGKYQEGDNFVIHGFECASLLKQRFRKSKREQQYFLHQHTISWVPRWARPGLKFIISLTQKLPFLNKMHGGVLIWPKREMLRHYEMFDENGERILIGAEARRAKAEKKKAKKIQKRENKKIKKLQ